MDASKHLQKVERVRVAVIACADIDQHFGILRSAAQAESVRIGEG
jgi:hypothetical protein